VIDLTRR